MSLDPTRVVRRVMVATPVLVWLAAQPGAAAGQAAQSAPRGRIVEATTARGVTAGAPVGPTVVFSPDAGPIFVWFRHEGLPDGATVSSAWFYDEENPPRRIADASITVQAPSDWGQFNLELPPGRLWPAGNYRVELTFGNAVLAEVKFKVVGAARGAASAKAPARYTHPRAGFSLDVPEGWSVEESPSGSTVVKRPDGNGLIEITMGPTSMPLDPLSYAAGWESVSVGPGKRLLVRRGARDLTVDGDRAFEGTYDGEGVVVRVVFLAKRDRFFVMTAVAPRDDSAQAFDGFDRVLASFQAGPGPGARQP